jgi:hypothetical protein
MLFKNGTSHSMFIGVCDDDLPALHRSVVNLNKCVALGLCEWIWVQYLATVSVPSPLQRRPWPPFGGLFRKQLLLNRSGADVAFGHLTKEDSSNCHHVATLADAHQVPVRSLRPWSI